VSALLVGLEVRRRAPDVAVAALAGIWLASRDLNPWRTLCVEGIVLTAIASLHAVRGPSEGRPAMPVGPGLLVTLATATVFLLVAGVGAGMGAAPAWWLAGGVLMAWVLVVSAGGEVAGRTWGPGPGALLATALPATLALGAPLLGSPFFPEASGVALAVSPLVAAGRLLGVEIAQAPPLYQWSSLGITEFRYPSPMLHPVLACVVAAGFLHRATRRRSRTCA